METKKISGSYSAAEIAILGRLYPEASRADILKALPGRTWISVRNMADRQRLKRSRTLNDKWRGRPSEIVRQYFPTEGVYYVVKMLGPGYTVDGVRGVAKRLGIVRLTPGVHVKPRVKKKKVAKVAKPKPEPKPVPAPPMKRSPATPVLNARMSIKKSQDKPTPLSEILEAQRKMKANDPRRLAFTIAARQGMPAAIKAWDEWPKQQAA